VGRGGALGRLRAGHGLVQWGDEGYAGGVHASIRGAVACGGVSRAVVQGGGGWGGWLGSCVLGGGGGAPGGGGVWACVRRSRGRGQGQGWM